MTILLTTKDQLYFETLITHYKLTQNIISKAKPACVVSQGTITHLDNVVEFLHKVGIDNERTQTFNSGVRVSSTPLVLNSSAVRTEKLADTCCTQSLQCHSIWADTCQQCH